MRKHLILRSPDVIESSSPAGTQAQPQAAPPPSSATPQDAPLSPASADEGFSMSDLSKFDEAFGQKSPEDKPEPSTEVTPDAKKEAQKSSLETKPDSKAKPAIESGPKQLREKLAAVERDLEAERKTKADLERRIAEKDAAGKDSTALSAALTEKDKEIETLRSKMRGLEFTASPEFNKNYQVPFEKAVTRASRDIQTMKVGQYVKDENTDQMVFQPVDGVNPWDDGFARIYAIDNRIAAMRAISERFSAEDAPFVKEHYSRLKELDEAKKEAQQEEQANWKSNVEKEAGQRAQQQENFRNAALAHRKELEARLPELFAADPNDPETSKRLQQGYAMIEYQPKTFEEAVQLNTRIRMNAAALPMMAYKYNKMKAERDAAIAKLEAGNTRGPGVGKKTSGSPSTVKKAEKEEFSEWAEGLREAATQ